MKYILRLKFLASRFIKFIKLQLILVSTDSNLPCHVLFPEITLMLKLLRLDDISEFTLLNTGIMHHFLHAF
jgi:hypothetical protein